MWRTSQIARHAAALVAVMAGMSLSSAAAQSPAPAYEGAFRNGGSSDAERPPAGGRDIPPGMPPPVRAFTDAEGRICNVYAHQVTIDGGAQTAYATVCRQSNGRWVLVR